MISYGSKTDELLKILKCEDVLIRPEELTLEKFQNVWNYLESNYDSKKMKLEERYNQIHQELLTKLETL